MEFNVTLKATDGRMVTMAAQQANAIQQINNTRKAGIASVVGYQPTTGYVEGKSPVQDIQLIAHISIGNLYKRRLEALKAIAFNDILPLCLDDEVLSGSRPETISKAAVKRGENAITYNVKSLAVLFDDRIDQDIASLETSLAAFSGETVATDSHREAHKLCYAHFGSVKVNLVTEGKPKTPVLDEDGNVQLASIMVPYIELNVTTKVKGERKPAPDSKGSVRMKNIIQRALNKRSTNLKTLSLKADNFEAFNIDGTQILAEDVARLGDLIAA
jgi:hypothetical protein